MSNEFESQIKESIFEDKLLNFYKKFKFYIIVSLLLIVLVPIIYQIKVYKNYKNNESLLELYSNAIIDLKNKDFKKAAYNLEKLVQSENNTVALLSLYQLYDLKKNSKSELIKIIDKIIDEKKINKNNLQLLNLKKSLIVFDDANENEMLKILNIQSKDNFFNKINLSIMYDFYISRNQSNKALELKKIIDGK